MKKQGLYRGKDTYFITSSLVLLCIFRLTRLQIAFKSMIALNARLLPRCFLAKSSNCVDYLSEFWPAKTLLRWNLYLPDTLTPLVCNAKDLVMPFLGKMVLSTPFLGIDLSKPFLGIDLLMPFLVWECHSDNDLSMLFWGIDLSRPFLGRDLSVPFLGKAPFSLQKRQRQGLWSCKVRGKCDYAMLGVQKHTQKMVQIVRNVLTIVPLNRDYRQSMPSRWEKFYYQERDGI